MSDYVIGLDFGSDSVRALAVDVDSGREIAAGVAPYRQWARGRYCDAAAQRFRQHPGDHLQAMTAAVRTCLDAAPKRVAERVAGIGVDTTGSSPLPVDEAGTALALRTDFADDPDAMCVLWKDHTAHREAAAINTLAHGGKHHDYTAYCGGIYSSEWFWAKIWHVAAGNATVRKAAFSWVEHCDWIPAVLCDATDPLTLKRSRCAAGHKAMWHTSWGGLPDADFLGELHPYLGDLRDRLYTDTHTVDEVAGTLSRRWAGKLGLPAGIPVAVGAFDAHLGAVGAGAQANALIKVMGTSTCDMVVAKSQDIGDTLIPGICGQVDGSVVPGAIGLEAGQSAFGDAYAWFRDQLAWPLRELVATDRALPKAERAALVERHIDAILPALSKRAAALPPGGTGELAVDWLNGRRTPDADPHARGALTGLHLGSDAPTVFRSLVEATAYGARAIAERIEDGGVPIKRVIALGGIAKKSDVVMQIHADVLGRRIDVVASEQCCALGAAMAAATAAGCYRTLKAAQKAMATPIAETYRPNRTYTRTYDDLYARYRELGASLNDRRKE